MQEQLTKAVDRPKNVNQAMQRCRSSFIDVKLAAYSANAMCDHIEQMEAEVAALKATIDADRDMILRTKALVESKDAEIASLRQAVQQALSFVEKVTHWEEGKPDRHDTLVSLRAVIAQAVQP